MSKKQKYTKIKSNEGNFVNQKLRNMTSLYLRYENSLLLLYRIGSRVVPDSFIASAGGHFKDEELNDPKACVLRELYEETGLTEQDISNLSLRYITVRLKNNEIRQNYYFFADLKDGGKAFTSNEGNLKWFNMDKMSANMPEMPFSAHYVIKHYLYKGKDTNALYVGAAAESGVEFTEMKEF